MKTKIDVSKLESVFSSYKYQKKRYDDCVLDLNRELSNVQHQLQMELRANRLNLPDGETRIKLGYDFYVSVTCLRGMISKIEPVVPVDLYDLQVDVVEEVIEPVTLPSNE